MSYDLPALILAFLMLLPGGILFLAHRAGFPWADLLKDADGKASAVRLGVPVSLAVSSWFTMYTTIAWPNKELAFYVQGLYLLTWSGALILVKILERWDGKLPFTTR